MTRKGYVVQQNNKPMNEGVYFLLLFPEMGDHSTLN